ncbi:MAG TPA: outer membrane protein transport protein [Nitrospiraceae bacterium]|nr:outer membrane protein transport protein [Nitrospiraceae bacterium]
MVAKKNILAIAGMAVTLLLPALVQAGGLFLTEFGTEDVALASAGWAARAQDASTLFKNPAGMSRLEGNQFQGGLQALYFQSGGFSGTNTPYGGNGGGNPIGVLPAASGFYVHSLGKDFKVGLGMLGNFGLALKNDQGFLGRYYVKQATLIGITFAPVASYQVNEYISIGGGPNVMLAHMKTTANINDLGPNTGDGQILVSDTTAGVGGQFGVLVEPKKGTRVGVTYYSPIKLNLSTTPTFSDLGAIGTNLQNNGLLTRNLDLGMTVPQHVILSGYHELSDAWAIMGDFGWENWSQFGKVDVAVTGGQNSPSLTTTTNYNDIYHVAIGSQYRLSPEWLLNGGFAYDSSMVSAANRTLAVPVAANYKFGMGANWRMNPKVKLGFSYELIYSGDMSISQNRGPLAGQVTGAYKDAMMHFFAFTLNWGSQGVTFGPGDSAS